MEIARYTTKACQKLLSVLSEDGQSRYGNAACQERQLTLALVVQVISFWQCLGNLVSIPKRVAGLVCCGKSNEESSSTLNAQSFIIIL